MTVKDRIKAFCKTEGITVSAFEKSIGVSNGYVNAISRSIGIDNLNTIVEKYSNLNIEWLLTGRGDMQKRNVSSKEHPISEPPSASDKDTKNTASTQENRVSFSPSVGTPYYDVDFHGGFAELFNDQTAIPTCNVVVPGFEKAGVWCNVTGHSMEPRISHGDIIALRECTIDDIQYGEIYAVVLDTIRTIKILRKGSTAKTLRYIPINTRDFDEQEYPIRRIVKIYEVIGSISRFF